MKPRGSLMTKAVGANGMQFRNIASDDYIIYLVSNSIYEEEQ